MRYYKGDLVAVFWKDPQGLVNEPVKDCHSVKAINYGIIADIRDEEIVLQSGIYTEEDVPFGDSTAIPKGCITRTIVVMKSRDLKKL